MLYEKCFIQGINTLKAQRDVSIRLVDIVDKLVSFICSVYLDYSFLFVCFCFLRWRGQISLVFQYVAFNTQKITFPV